jgi:hypothetical protein
MPPDDAPPIDAAAREVNRRERARRHIESAEAWARKLIDSELSAAYGTNYLAVGSQTVGLSKRFREQVEERRAKEPNRYPRLVDAMTFGEATAILVHPELYPKYFKSALEEAYPDGPAEARTFLSRLEGHRNRIQHGGTCSFRDLEQCTCYANDLIDSLKAYFVRRNMERIFNVPTFTRAVDNRGNDFHLSPKGEDQAQFIDVRTQGNGDLYPGETLVIEVEVDESFSDYSIRWSVFNGGQGFGPILQLRIEPKHVAAFTDIRFEVVSAQQWHRLPGGCDDRLDLRYRVLPPV